ncbi:imidazole glycerol phosphate synthase subunit HisF [Lentisphaera profundi]|uniref:Imidazole glycerol phosphate synthase subunit HisF n=1 Tax=Lentisphaera profundi TaxID=1658616 RepID=A0ABY7VRV4_9BACT|nr:imidazole glycerol phosphate synthase subunit HisF [Lentisphaera profundi]WDE95622.1 imidazole glycerol phosphate synthase subunit HisF [Lentisphaera profundi]
MLNKRLIVCLDVRNKKVTKGIKFKGNVDIGDPVEMACQYVNDGVDELVFYDITASAEQRPIDLDMVRDVAKNVFIPFSVGGGIRNVDDMRNVLLAGAEKVSLNSLAVRDPQIIHQGAQLFGKQCIVLGMDAQKVEKSEKFPSGYQVVIHGGRTETEKDALAWAQEAEQLGAGEICLNSIDADGMKQGYDLELTQLISKSVQIPVIASGGAGDSEHLIAVLSQTHAEAALVASMVHYGTHTCSGIKEDLNNAQIPTRMDW